MVGRPFPTGSTGVPLENPSSGTFASRGSGERLCSGTYAVAVTAPSASG